MSNIKTQVGTVRYNLETERFEALVTLHLSDGPTRVAAQFSAPITADFEYVARGLWNAALAQVKRPDALRTRLAPIANPQLDLPLAA